MYTRLLSCVEEHTNGLHYIETTDAPVHINFSSLHAICYAACNARGDVLEKDAKAPASCGCAIEKTDMSGVFSYKHTHSNSASLSPFYSSSAMKELKATHCYFLKELPTQQRGCRDDRVRFLSTTSGAAALFSGVTWLCATALLPPQIDKKRKVVKQFWCDVKARQIDLIKEMIAQQCSRLAKEKSSNPIH